jgi:hypothetical protein
MLPAVALTMEVFLSNEKTLGVLLLTGVFIKCCMFLPLNNDWTVSAIFEDSLFNDLGVIILFGL